MGPSKAPVRAHATAEAGGRAADMAARAASRISSSPVAACLTRLWRRPSGAAAAASTSGGLGGGAVGLNVAGILRVDGMLTADGLAPTDCCVQHGAGAGGSLWIDGGHLDRRRFDCCARWGWRSDAGRRRWRRRAHRALSHAEHFRRNHQCRRRAGLSKRRRGHGLHQTGCGCLRPGAGGQWRQGGCDPT